VRLGQLERRNAEFALERAAQVSFAHTQLAGERGDAATVQGTCCNLTRGRVRETRYGIAQRSAGSQLGPTTKAGTIAGTLSRGR
jgi:hypothetical protein